MRVILVGPAVERERLRLALDGTSIEVVGEAPTVEAARARGADADALLLPASFEPRRPFEEAPTDEPLTPREWDVLRLVAEGLPNKAIASRLGISDQTVKFHVASIVAKLGAGNRTAAVRLAIRRGLVEI
jgi:DNA-binding CsgD family transcriptional regulator